MRNVVYSYSELPDFFLSFRLRLVSITLKVASHAVVFRGLVLPPPYKQGRGYTSPLKTTAWEAI